MSDNALVGPGMTKLQKYLYRLENLYAHAKI